MSSSLNSWSGRCQSEQIQEQLCQRVLLLAQIAGGFFPEPQAATLTDTTLSGGVLVEAELLGGSMPSYPVVQSGCRQRYTLDAVHLYGVEFRIFDCRNRAILSDKISLLFVRGEELDLNGRIVERYPLKETRDQIVGATECGDGEILYRLSNGDTIRTGDRDFERPEEWLIQSPTLHLRYYLEKWARRFFVWIKTYFIEDLEYYDRWGGLPEVSYSAGALADSESRWNDLVRDFIAETEALEKKYRKI